MGNKTGTNVEKQTKKSTNECAQLMEVQMPQ